MRKEYGRNKKIAIFGTAKTIAAAEAALDTIEDLEGDIAGFRLHNEGVIRLKIQDAIDTHNIQATILVDGNTVYPFKKAVNQYEQLKKSGKLDKMTDFLYKFLHLNFDIAHYDKNGYIWHYGNDFDTMHKTVLDKASTPGWHTDVRRILNYVQGLSIEDAA
jgi:hypothetical protein